MEEIVFGGLGSEGLEIVSRGGLYFVRYDAGSYNVYWREDEFPSVRLPQVEVAKRLNTKQFLGYKSGSKRLVPTHMQNWVPTSRGCNRPLAVASGNKELVGKLLN